MTDLTDSTLKTHFISTEVTLSDAQTDWQAAILRLLRTHGEPLRWAITSIDATTQIASIDAIVTTPHAPSSQAPTSYSRLDS